MGSQPLIISLCRHVLPCGRRCLQPAVGGRACCRHHLDARTRLHNMARARRRTLVPRLRVLETARDLEWNQIEINRLLATERIDPEVAVKILWAMDLSAVALRAESHAGLRRATNLNGIYDVSPNPLIPRSLSENLSQVSENTQRRWRGYTTPNTP